MKRLLVFMFVLLIGLAGRAGAETVQSIEIVGQKRLEAGAIREVMTTRVGRPFSESVLNADLRTIYQMGYFDDVRGGVTDAAGGVAVTITVRERPTIRAISYEGNSKIETEEIEKEVSLKLFSTLDQTKISEAVRKIKKLYDQDGYYLVEIRPEIRPLGESEVEVIFKISENRQVRIRSIEFLGNRALSDRKLRKAMATRRANMLSFLTKAGTYDQDLLATDVQRLIYAYHDHGYLEAKVSEPTVELSPDRRALSVSFGVEEGEVYTIASVQVSGDIIFPPAELVEALQQKKGQTFRRSILEKDLQTLNEKYSDQGFFYVNVRPIDRLNRENRTVDLTLEVEKGVPVYFERINILGNTITRDKVIRRELQVTEGELFNLTRLRKSLENVKRLGYFEDVTPSTPRGSTDNQIDLNIDVKEKPTGTFSVGAGFSSVDKFIFNAQVSKDNFLGRGLKGELSAQIGSRRKLFNLALTDPYFFDTAWLVGFSAFRSDVEYTDFNRSALGGEIQVGRPLIELLNTSITYRLENVSIEDVNPAVSSFFTDGITSSLLWGLTRDARDNRLFPKKGTFNGLYLELAGGPLQGDNEFFKVRYNGRAYYPIWKDIVVSAQGTIGWIGSVSGKEVPIFERFFLGGINSVRGFRARSIGPTRQVVNLDPASPDYEFTVGGNKELVFNNELTFPIIPQLNIRGVLFFDAGNAFDDDETYDITDLRMSYGAGLRWSSPLGPLRFEFGIPINRRANEEPSAFEFSIGSSF